MVFHPPRSVSVMAFLTDRLSRTNKPARHRVSCYCDLSQEAGAEITPDGVRLIAHKKPR